jgi:hypothetical protein
MPYPSVVIIVSAACPAVISDPSGFLDPEAAAVERAAKYSSTKWTRGPSRAGFGRDDDRADTAASRAPRNSGSRAGREEEEDGGGDDDDDDAAAAAVAASFVADTRSAGARTAETTRRFDGDDDDAPPPKASAAGGEEPNASAMERMAGAILMARVVWRSGLLIGRNNNYITR